MDLDILTEATNLQTAHVQMEVAELAYNEAEEQATNKQRELHELKPPTWWASVFNTDGALRHREEKKKIEMSLTFAKDTMSKTKVRQLVLEPASQKYKGEGYAYILGVLQKQYGRVKGQIPDKVIQSAASGKLIEGDTLAYARSTQAAAKEYQQLSSQSLQHAKDHLTVTKAIHDLPKPSFVASLLKTPSYQQYKLKKDQLEHKKKECLENSLRTSKSKEQHRDQAYQYYFAGRYVLNKYDEHQQQIILNKPHTSIDKSLDLLSSGPTKSTAIQEDEPRRPGQRDPTGLGLDPELSQHLRDSARDDRARNMRLHAKNQHPNAFDFPAEPPRPTKKSA